MSFHRVSCASRLPVLLALPDLTNGKSNMQRSIKCNNARTDVFDRDVPVVLKPRAKRFVAVMLVGILMRCAPLIWNKSCFADQVQGESMAVTDLHCEIEK